jgi:DNA-binding response OmpR family regulator
MARVLIVEDDATLQRVLRDNFAAAGHTVHTAGDGEAGLEEALAVRPDLVILDIMLPRLSGFEICRQLKQAQFGGGILMLTARVEDGDAVLGLGLGADDYVRKPFNIRELLARAEAIMRRALVEKPTQVSFDDCVVDLRGRQLLRNGKVVDLSPKEYELLTYLIENEGRAMSREQIMTAVWGYDARVSDRSIDRFMTHLRKKIERDVAEPRHLLTIRQFGYKFVL